MPYTEEQTRYLLSSGSPLNAVEKEKVKGELKADPSMGHKKPGPDANAASLARYRSYRNRAR